MLRADVLAVHDRQMPVINPVRILDLLGPGRCRPRPGPAQHLCHHRHYVYSLGCRQQNLQEIVRGFGLHVGICCAFNLFSDYLWQRLLFTYAVHFKGRSGLLLRCCHSCHGQHGSAMAAKLQLSCCRCKSSVLDIISCCLKASPQVPRLQLCATFNTGTQLCTCKAVGVGAALKPCLLVLYDPHPIKCPFMPCCWCRSGARLSSPCFSDSQDWPHCACPSAGGRAVLELLFHWHGRHGCLRLPPPEGDQALGCPQQDDQPGLVRLLWLLQRLVLLCQAHQEHSEPQGEALGASVSMQVWSIPCCHYF